MKRFFLLFFSILLTALSVFGCTDVTAAPFTATFYDVFDTVTILKGYASSRTEFDLIAEKTHQALLEYHTLYDIYHDAPDGNNLKTVNDLAGVEPVKVDRKIIDLILFCRESDEVTSHKVSAMFGSVLCLWHDARTVSLEDPSKAYIPAFSDLDEASRHTGFNLLVVDEEASTLFITDPCARLDVGALAKGYTAEKIISQLPDGFLLSLGGNIAVKGAKPDGSAWNVGVQDPDDSSALYHILSLTDASVVTSGDYQREYVFDGKQYHHIIDPDTLYPSQLWKSVTVVCTSSAIGDALSTALFILDKTEGQKLLDLYEAQAMWISQDGTVFYSEGFLPLIKAD